MSTPRITLRTADASQASRLHALITANIEEGHLLPRTLGEIVVHVERFVVALRGRRIVGCAELAPLSTRVAEVRSLAVDRGARGLGVGALLVEELRTRARRDGFETLCAFTHSPAYFSQMGYSIVPHLWVPEKVFTDCVKCPLFRHCGQYAMVVPVKNVQNVQETVTLHHLAADADRSAAVEPARVVFQPTVVRYA